MLTWEFGDITEKKNNWAGWARLTLCHETTFDTDRASIEDLPDLTFYIVAWFNGLKILGVEIYTFRDRFGCYRS